MRLILILFIYITYGLKLHLYTKKLPYKDTKIILKLHNFRYDCAGSFFVFRHLKGKDICGACGFNKKNNPVFNKYSENSYLKSFLVILFQKNLYLCWSKEIF